MPAGPAPVLKAIAPSRAARVVCGACLVTGSWLADLWARAGMPCGRGHALDMQALQGGKAKHDTLDAPTMAVVLRGGRLPQASGAPAARRATRELTRAIHRAV